MGLFIGYFSSDENAIVWLRRELYPRWRKTTTTETNLFFWNIFSTLSAWLDWKLKVERLIWSTSHILQLNLSEYEFFSYYTMWNFVFQVIHSSYILAYYTIFVVGMENRKAHNFRIFYMKHQSEEIERKQTKLRQYPSNRWNFLPLLRHKTQKVVIRA